MSQPAADRKWLEAYYARNAAALAGRIPSEFATTEAPKRGKKAKRLRPVSNKPVAQPGEYKLVLTGHCPAKKNRFSVTNGQMRYEPETRKQIDALRNQAALLWAYAPVERCEVSMHFYFRNVHRDLDNAFSGCLDCLKSAEVIVDDKLPHVQRIHATGEHGDNEQVVVTITVLPEDFA